MSTFTIPSSQKQIRQFPNSDTFGELTETFNIDLSSDQGKIKASKKLVKVLDRVTHLGNSSPTAFAIYKSNYYITTTNNTYRCSVNDDPTVPANWNIETGIAVTQQFGTDAVVFNDLLLISGTTNIASWDNSNDNATWWTTTTSGTALTTGVTHTMHVHRGGQETLFVTDKSEIRYYNTTAGHSTVQLQTDLTSSCIASGVNAIWVGTYTESQENAYVYEIYVGEQIDGAPVARNAYKVDGRAVLSIQVIDNIPYIVTEKGTLQAFNGVGFTTVASFPFSLSTDTLSGVVAGLVQDSNRSRPIHPKGIQPNNDSLYININTELEAGAGYPDKSASGIWEYDKNTKNLTHRFAFCNTSTQRGSRENEFTGPLIVLDNSKTLLMAGGSGLNFQDGMFAVSNTATPYGYFVTTEIESGTVQDSIEAVYLKARTMTTQSVSLKYRITKRDKQYVPSGTFLSTNTLNTTETVIVAVGDEITLLDGTNTGYIAHVLEVNVSGGTTSLVLDTDIGIVNETVVFEIQNWKLLLPIYTTEGELIKIGIGETCTFIQYKVVFDGAVELRQLISKSNSKNEL